MGPDGPSDKGSAWNEFLPWMAGFVLFALVIPGLIVLFLPSDQRAHAIAVLASVPLLEYVSISVGIGLGLDPWVSLALTVSPCVGIVMLVMGAMDHLSGRSERVTRFRGRVSARIEKYPRLKRYGVVSNFLFVIVAGMYIAPGIAILMGWPKARSLLLMALGIVFITGLIGLATVGVVELFFV